MIALHGINTDVLQVPHSRSLNAFAYHSYLVTIGHDDTHRLVGIETVAIETPHTPEDVHDDARFLGIDLIGDFRLPTISRSKEQQAMAFEKVVDGIL